MLRRRSVLALVASGFLLFAGLASAKPLAYEIDAGHSSLLFRIKHLNVGYVYGRFNEFTGVVVVDDNTLSHARVEFTAKASSVDTGSTQRDEHLRKADFFNVAQFPEITYRSTSVTKVEGGYRVEGNLTLHGVTRPVAARINLVGETDDPWGNHRRGYEGSFSIKRSEFGMSNMLEMLSDQVDVTIAVETTREKK